MIFYKKKMFYHNWVSILISILVSILLLNTIFLYFTDTYSIANTTPKECFSVPNQKYLKTEYILKHKDNYDTFIFGSSRVGSINPYLIKNAKTYNMTYGEGVPREHLLILKLFIKNKVPIKNILIGLDDFSYQVSFAYHQQSFVPKSHYLATGESSADFYQFYFFRKPKSSDMRHFRRKFLNEPYEKNLIDGVCRNIFEQDKKYNSSIPTSTYSNKKKKSDVKYNLQLPVKNEQDKDLKCFNDTLNDIKEIVKITKKHDINLTIFINPVSRVTYSYLDKELLNDFKKKLSYITPYYDFSVPNLISDNDDNWIDGLHFNQDVGGLILTRIYDNNTSIKDFGIYVQKKDSK